MLGARVPPEVERRFARLDRSSFPIARDLPSSFDWRTLGAVSAVKNQAGCGSCWDFAGVAAVESQVLHQRGHRVRPLGAAGPLVRDPRHGLQRRLVLVGLGLPQGLRRRARDLHALPGERRRAVRGRVLHQVRDRAGRGSTSRTTSRPSRPPSSWPPWPRRSAPTATSARTAPAATSTTATTPSTTRSSSWAGTTRPAAARARGCARTAGGVGGAVSAASSGSSTARATSARTRSSSSTTTATRSCTPTTRSTTRRATATAGGPRRGHRPHRGAQERHPRAGEDGRAGDPLDGEPARDRLAGTSSSYGSMDAGETAGGTPAFGVIDRPVRPGRRGGRVRPDHHRRRRLRDRRHVRGHARPDARSSSWTTTRARARSAGSRTPSSGTGTSTRSGRRTSTATSRSRNSSGTS